MLEKETKSEITQTCNKLETYRDLFTFSIELYAKEKCDHATGNAEHLKATQRENGSVMKACMF